MSDKAFALVSPKELSSGVVFASPHSGDQYSETFLAQSILDETGIRSSEDAFVDQLACAAPEYGAYLLCAKAPRAYLDLNRAQEELDPSLIEGVVRRGQNPRVASGLGVIPRVVSNGRAIYRGKLPMSEAQARLDEFWVPYHRQLGLLLDQARERFGQTVLIDCHSMPHEAVMGSSVRKGQRPEIVLGDRFGASADSSIVDEVEAAFVAAGLAVSRNAPFAGAYITQSYGRPSRNQHAIQVEIDRALYMDEAQVRPNQNFKAFQDLMSGVICQIASIVSEPQRIAAE